MEGSFGPTRHVSQPGCVGGGGEMVTSTPLDLQRGCIRDAAVNI